MMMKSFSFKAESGLSLLEILVALSIATILMASAAKILHQSLYAQLTIKKEYQNNYQKHKLLGIMESIKTDIDRHPFKLLPRLHYNGQITYADGSINYPSNKLSLQANKDSTAISYFEIHLREAFRITNTEHGLITACPLFNERGMQLQESFLGIYPNGYAYLTGTGYASSGCRVFQLQMQKNMFIENPAALKSESLKIIIPIQNEYTFYRDNSDSLRYLGHRGNRNTELQAIYGNSLPFIIKESDRATKFYKLQLEILKKNKVSSFNFRHKIARHGFHQFMLSL